MRLHPYFLLLLIAMLPYKSNAQFGLTEFFIPLDDTASRNEIYRNVERIKVGEVQVYSGEDLKALVTVDGFKAIAKQYNFNVNGLIGVRSLVQWDVVHNEAIIAAYAPVFKNLPDTSVFYFLSIDVDVMVNSRVDSLLKEKTYAKLMKQANNYDNVDMRHGITYRSIDMHKFDCFYPVRLSYLTDLILLTGTNGEIPLLDKPFGVALDTRFTKSSSPEIEYIKKNRFKPDITKTLILVEQWQDTMASGHVTVPFYLKYEQKIWAEKQNWDHMRKKIIGFGLILDDGQIVWAKFDDIAPIMALRESRMQLFDFLFESSFCEQIHTEIWRDYEFQY